MPENIAAPLGQWPNAPLAFVVAELQFERIVDLERKLADVHGLLSETYPLYEVTGLDTLTALPDATQMVRTSEPAHDYRNLDNTTGVRITANNVQLHTVVYTDYSDFCAKWARVLEVVTQVLRPRIMARAGLRYVDLIVPDEADRSPTDYLAPALANSAMEVEAVGQLEQQAVVLAYKDERVVSRVSLLNMIRVGMTLPPSFIPMPLTFSAIQSKALARQREGGPVGFLDFDVAHHGPQLLDSPRLRALYDDLHRRHSALFTGAISDLAKSQWQGA